MIQELKEVALDRRDEIRLSHTSGSVSPYKGFELPKIFTKPLIYDPNGEIQAFSSGGRGALLKYGKWFKLKGVRPERGKVYEDSGEPFGGMSRKKAIRELEANDLVNKGFKKYGYKGPLIPVGNIEYDIPFNGENICCSIFRTLGDTRIFNILRNKYQRALKERDKSLGEFFIKVSEWMGLTDRILIEQDIATNRYMGGLGNFTFYRLRDGYGIGPVDLSSSELDTGKAKRSNIFFMLDVIKVENFIGFPSLHDSMEEKYLDVFEGNIIPKPIEEKWITRFVG